MPPEPPLVDPYAGGAPVEAREAGGASGLAVASLVSAVLGFVCVPLLGGVLALILGAAARGESVRESRGGARMATAAMVLGGLNVLGSIAAVVALMLWTMPGSLAAPPAPPPRAFGPPPGPPSPLLAPPMAPPVAPDAGATGPIASVDTGTVSTDIGRITLVDVDRDSGTLRQILAEEQANAERRGQRLVLWTVVSDCQPCSGVAASLPDERMQRALGGVRLVRVSVRDFLLELSAVGVPTDKIPGFALMSKSGRPQDYVHGGEWDEDIAKNIAPVLGQFMTGSLSKRRDPWQGVRRDDETTL
ncbi:MAG: DUF4190 domain-containing protein [Polyangiaceae bacterium]|nr:DUF4190 domain-containing protein [Polyangiaceae bacterium]